MNKTIQQIRYGLILMILAVLLVSLKIRGECADIRLKSPVKKVTVTNTRLQNWWNSFTPGDGVKLAVKKEQCRPDPVRLKWTRVNNPKSYYRVYISTSPALKKPTVFQTKNNYKSIYNLLPGKTYYWKVKAYTGKAARVSRTQKFRTLPCARTIYVDGAYNTRDIGGYQTQSGETVRQGMIYRSGNFDSISNKGRNTIKQLGIRTQIDLRFDGEGNVGRATLPVRTYRHMPGHAYKTIFSEGKYIKREIAVMKMFTKEENYPIVFHCIYGRDRTGTLAFLINGLLGVNRKDLYRDYELTFLSRHSSSNADERYDKFSDLYDRMSRYKDASQSLSYNIRAYLIDNGMTEAEINEIRRIMLE